MAVKASTVSEQREMIIAASAPHDGVAGVTASSANPFLLEDYIGRATWAGKPIFDQAHVRNQIDSGTFLNSKNGVVTFSFSKQPTGLYNSPKEEAPEPAGFSQFSDAEKAVAREAIKLWDDLIPLKFVEKNGQGADILFANTTTGPAQAWAYYPQDQKYKHVGSDVWTADPDVNWTNGWLGYGDYGRTTLVHELGHTLGLSHPGNYNFSDDNDGDGQPDPITYEADAFYAQDTQQFSIMSYFSEQKSGGQSINVSVGLLNNPQTPLLHDIMTIQAKYGADPATRLGSTNYFSNSNAGNAVYDLAKNPFPYLSVYDAGGDDTFDFSTANSGVFIDLRPGAFSSATLGYQTMEQANQAIAAFNAVSDEAQGDFSSWNHTPGSANNYEAWVAFVQSIGASRVAADTGVSGITATSHRNISIAYNTIIENANGGSARDYLFGNDVSNKLNGNGGNDVIDGSKGNDIYTGGAGNDEFRISQIGYTDTITDFTAGDRIRVSEIDANTTNAAGSNDAFSFIGNAAFGHVAGQLRYDGNVVQGDVNGDGIADFSIVIQNHAALVASDFFL